MVCRLLVVTLMIISHATALVPVAQAQLAASAVPEFTGYTDRISYFPGEDIAFHVSSPTTNNSYKLFIYREGGARELVHTQASARPAVVNSDLAHGEFGYAWEASATISGAVTAGWRSGYYLARLEKASSNSPPPLTHLNEVIPFIIKPAAPSSKIIVQLPTNTWLAYNDRFGRSYYTEPRTFHTTFHRPMQRYVKWISGVTSETVTDTEGYYLRWLEQNGYQVDVIANSDMIDDSIVNAGNYRLFISVGHDEYWSTPMRNTLQAFLDGGGNALFWSSDEIYYQTREEDNGAVMLSYKLYEYCSQHDPLFGVDDSQVTTWWAKPPVNNPETKLTGLSYHYGGVGVGGYQVYRTNDWPFQGTGLRNGDVIGNYPIAGDDILAQEVDATYYTWSGGQPYPTRTGETGTPANFTILGVAHDPASAPALMGYYTTPQGATVFHTGTWDWWKGLILNDPKTIQITRNVLARLTEGALNPAPVDQPTYSTRALRQGVDGYAGAADTTLNLDAPDQNFGGAGTLDLAHNRDGDRKAALVRFDVSALAAINPADIVSAQIRLYPVALQNGGELKVSELLPSGPWQEQTATWNQPATGATWPGGSGTTGKSLENEFIRVTRRAISFEVTDQLRQWLADPNSNRGVALRGYTTYDNNYGRTLLSFAASEHADLALRPELVVRLRGCGLVGDVNQDQAVDVLDIQAVASRWNTRASAPSSGYDARFDLDRDGDVDIADIQKTAGAWGSRCP
jgi:hypothetical protein